MNITEASKILALSTKTLRRYIKRGLLEARKGSGQGGQAWDIPMSSIEDFKQKLQSGLIHPTVEKVDKDGQRTGSLVKVDKSGPPGQEVDIQVPSKCPASLPPRARMDWGRYLDSLPDLLNAQEVSAFLGVSGDTVRKLLKEGTLHGAKLGKAWKISKASLERFIKELLG